MTVHDDLAELAGIGRDAERGGWSRHLWDDAELRMRDWFRRRAAVSGLAALEDRNGNLWAWAGEPVPDAVVTGSHLDSVPGGGALDGPLGVVSAFAAVDRLLLDGAPARPLAVVAFAEEEGSRFGVACLGSRLLTGGIDPDRARGLTDAAGTTFTAAAAGRLDLAGIGRDEEALARIGVLVELHVEQGRVLADLGAPVAVATSVLAHGRWRLDVTGEGDHAGTTPMAGRRDPMVAAARCILTARDAARAAAGSRATVGRLQVLPGATNAIPRSVRAWLDARGPLCLDLDALAAAFDAVAAEEGCTAVLLEESRSAEVRFDAALRARIRSVLGPVPELATGAGHDAAVLAAAVPTAMLFVRNPTGVSHAPAESASPADVDAGVDALTTVLRDLAGR